MLDIISPWHALEYLLSLPFGEHLISPTGDQLNNLKRAASAYSDDVQRSQGLYAIKIINGTAPRQFIIKITNHIPIGNTIQVRSNRDDVRQAVDMLAADITDGELSYDFNDVLMGYLKVYVSTNHKNLCVKLENVGGKKTIKVYSRAKKTSSFQQQVAKAVKDGNGPYKFNVPFHKQTYFRTIISRHNAAHNSKLTVSIDLATDTITVTAPNTEQLVLAETDDWI